MAQTPKYVPKGNAWIVPIVALLVSVAVHLVAVYGLRIPPQRLIEPEPPIRLSLLIPDEVIEQPPQTSSNETQEPAKPRISLPELQVPQVKSNSETSPPVISEPPAPQGNQTADVVTNPSVEATPPPAVENPALTSGPSTNGEQQGSQPTENLGVGNPNPPGPDLDAILAGYRRQVLADISAHKAYPPTARRLSQEGEAKVRFRIAANGAISDVSLVTSSGIDSLDQAALEAVKSASPVHPIPGELNENSLVLSLTVVFSLDS